MKASLLKYQGMLRGGVGLLAIGGLGVLTMQCARTQTPEAERPAKPGVLLAGHDAFGDYHTDAPGVRRKLTVADLPAPYTTPSADNGASMAPRPPNSWPKAPPGFVVQEYLTHLDNPRKIITAPNGDLFVVESGPGRVRVLRGITADGHPTLNKVFATGLSQPFGIAFYPAGPHPRFVYVGNTGSVVRFPYQNGDTEASGPAETIVPDIPSGGRLRGGGHWTRDVVFTRDSKKMFVSVGSHSNDAEGKDDQQEEERRADILQYNPDGTAGRIYASGIRNPVGLAINPLDGQLWTSVNERDRLGDHLVPDYITHVRDGGFYGWPWFYMGAHQDPRHKGEHDEMASKVIVPDILLQSHSASLAMTFYNGTQFPAPYRGQIFASEHGSWNRAHHTGYKVIMAPMRAGKAVGEYQDFLTGFVAPDGGVWGRPVGVTTAADGSLMVTDDGAGTIWRVAYKGK